MSMGRGACWEHKEMAKATWGELNEACINSTLFDQMLCEGVK